MKLVVAALSVIIAIAAGVFAWQKNLALEASRLELANTQSSLEKAEARIKPLEASVEALRKENAAYHAAQDQFRVELNSSKLFLAAEKESGARLRAELEKTKEMLVAMSKMRAPPQAIAPPMLVRPAPLRVVPAGSGAAIGVGIPAR
jgi:hypothetical protein